MILMLSSRSCAVSNHEATMGLFETRLPPLFGPQDGQRRPCAVPTLTCPMLDWGGHASPRPPYDFRYAWPTFETPGCGGLRSMRGLELDVVQSSNALRF